MKDRFLPLSCAMAGVLFAPILFARTQIDLSGDGWTCDGVPVSVPHTWNAIDATDGPENAFAQCYVCSAANEVSYARKRAVYRRPLPEVRKGRRYFVKCEGASVRAEVSVNGRLLGRHIGAFTAFGFEITDALVWTNNVLEIAVDNRRGFDTQPLSADYSVFGGLYRKVWLIETGAVCIDPVWDGANGVRIETYPKTGDVVAKIRVLGGTNEIQRFRVPNYELWSPESPKLYSHRFSIDQGGCEDSVEVRFGFRTIEFRGDGLYLNGRRRQLRGVNRHQDREGKGWAVSETDEEEDIRLIKDMGADALRTAHYPQSQHVYDLCDELGIICWVEHPNNVTLRDTPEFRENSDRQIREMVVQLSHHPSIAMWGLWNELRITGGDDAEIPGVPTRQLEIVDHAEASRFLSGQQLLFKRLDPTRPTVAASDKTWARSINDITDALAYNRYPKWYSNLTMRGMLDEMFAADDRGILGMSEYGVGGSIVQHDHPMRHVRARGRWHPEEHQAFLMHDNLLALQSDPHVWGHFVWAMFDFGSDSRTEGDRDGINDKGLVTYDRQTRKDAYYLYRANWRDEPILHLVGSRMTTVTNDVMAVMGFSTVGRVTLRVNGQVVGCQHPDEARTVIWTSVDLAKGANMIELSAGGLTARARWMRVDPRSGYRFDRTSPETYDMVIAGGTLEAVRTAVRKRAEGQRVFLLAPRPYCGEDRAATLDLVRHPEDDVDDPLIREIFNPDYRASGAYNVLKATGPKAWRAVRQFEPYENVMTDPVTGALDKVTTPLLVKRACDRALLAAGVDFLTGAQVVAAGKSRDGLWRVTYASRDGEKVVLSREFVDKRVSRRIAKGRHDFSYRLVRGPKPHVEVVDFSFDVPYSDARGVMAVENHAREIVNPTNLLDVAEWVVVRSASNAPPENVIASYDVVVVGGGTGGGPAAVAAARSGARTLLVEYQNVLGGVVSEGRIGNYGSYYDGNVCGFTQELEEGETKFGKDADCAYFFARSEFLRREIVRAGGEVWLGVLAHGVEMDGNRVTGVKVALPDGTRGVVRCDVVVDATGNSDIAAAAGAETEFIAADELSLQGCGMAGQPLGSGCVNSDIGFVDETDAADLCFFALRSRLNMPDRIWNQSSLVDSRERRRIVGDIRISPIDLFLNRRYPDVVCTARSSFDTHGQTAHPIFFIRDTGKHGDFVMANVPYRALLPRGVEGVLVTGLGISAHRDAMPVLRMKADIQNQGFAAGLAAAMSVKDGVSPRRLDVRKLQRHLVNIGNLGPETLEWQDALPLSDGALRSAVRRIRNGYDGLPEVMSDQERAIPLLREEHGFECVHVRALLGDPFAAEGMIAKLKDASWDEGWNYKGMSQYLRSVGMIDRYVIALGNTRSKAALSVLDRLASELTGASEYSHFRALALAYESIGDRTGAAALARLLKLEGVGGHAIGPNEIPPIPGYADPPTNVERSNCLRELCIARALYRLGDVEGLGERTLEAYSRDPRRVYANHARKVLSR